MSVWPPSQSRPPQASPFGTVAASRACMEMGGSRDGVFCWTVTGMRD